MATRREIRRAIRAVLLPRRVSAELGDELAFHLEMEAAQHAGRGLGDDAARALAEQRFGNVAVVLAELHSVHRCGAPEWLAAPGMTVARFVARASRRGRSEMIAVASLVLSAAAAVVAFAMTDSALGLPRWLGVGGTERIVQLGLQRFSRDGSPPQTVLPYALLASVRSNVPSFADVAAVRTQIVAVHVDGGVRAATGAFVSASYAHTVDARTSLGTWPDWRDSTGNSDRVVVSDAFWRFALHGRPNAIGSRITVGRTVFTVGAIAARGFRASRALAPIDLWLPIDRSAMRMQPDWRVNSQVHSVRIIARLRDGATRASASTDIRRLARGDSAVPPGIDVIPLDADARRAPAAWSSSRLGVILSVAASLLLLSAVAPFAPGARRFVPAIQLAAASALAVAAGLFAHSLWTIKHVPLGMRPTPVLALTIVDGGETGERAHADSAYARLLHATSSLASVESAALSAVIPMTGSYAINVRTDAAEPLPLTVEGGPYVNAVTSDYFAVVGTRLLRGRAFTTADVGTSLGVLIVNATAARLWWRTGDPLSQCVYIGGNDRCARVIGVVEDTRRRSVMEEASAQFFVPLSQAPSPLATGALLLRVSGVDVDDANTDRNALVRSLQAVVPDLPLTAVSVGAVTSRHWYRLSRGAWAFGLIALVALLIPAFGVYDLTLSGASGVMAVARVMATAAVAGVMVVWLGRGWIEPLLFQTRFSAVLTFVTATLPMVVTGGIAALALAARRHSRMSPITQPSAAHQRSSLG